MRCISIYTRTRTCIHVRIILMSENKTSIFIPRSNRDTCTNFEICNAQQLKKPMYNRLMQVQLARHVEHRRPADFNTILALSIRFERAHQVATASRGLPGINTFI